jgi:hypothetical protein
MEREWALLPELIKLIGDDLWHRDEYNAYGRLYLLTSKKLKDALSDEGRDQWTDLFRRGHRLFGVCQ